MLGDPEAGVELVAIDDASPDHGPQLLDELARRDERVLVHHTGERVGRGRGRNLGLDLATGTYVWFVETTDILAPGALADVSALLAAAEPEVLLVHHQIARSLGAARPGPHRRRLAAVSDRGPGPLDRHPGVAATAPHAWDKVIRLDDARRLGVRFGGGGHAELSVTWPLLLAAERIAATPRAAYVRRRPANAVSDRLADGTPFDVFDRYDAVFAFVAQHPEIPDERRRQVLPAALRHQLALLEQVPAPERRAFFRRMSESLNAHRRGDEPASGGRVAALRRSLVERDDFRGFRLLEEAVEGRRALGRRRAAVSRLRGRAAARVRSEQRERRYRAHRRRPIDPDLAVYAAYWYRGYSCNPRAIYERARELAPHVRGVWVVGGDAVASLPPGVEHVVAGSREYYDLLARARYFFNNVNFPNDFVKREGTVHVMTHHGTPLKHMGLDLRHSPVSRGRMDFGKLMRRCARWDYSVSSNPFSTIVWERVYPLPYETLEVGYPRNDVLVNAGDDDVLRVREQLGIEPGRRAVLYAPTHREYLSGYEPVLDLAEVADALDPDDVLLARLHYFYGADPTLRRLHRAGRVRDVARHPSIEELCLAADVLVTDYSSLMFDYATLDRPIVIHAPDWEVYRATRGTYFDLMAEPPGAVARSQGELVDILRTEPEADAAAEAARAAFRARFCSLEDGRAAERVVQRVLLGRREAPSRHPVPVA